MTTSRNHFSHFCLFAFNYGHNLTGTDCNMDLQYNINSRALLKKVLNFVTELIPTSIGTSYWG